MHVQEFGAQDPGLKRKFTTTDVRERDWYVAQYLEVDVASQGETAEEALNNITGALELHFEPPTATIMPDMRPIEVNVDAA